jgi:release factor glutamine methyltransferase
MAETVRSVLELAAKWLVAKGVDDARLEAELLLAHALKVKRLDLYLDRDRPLVEAELAPFRELLKRRAAREPLAYLTGAREFYTISFEVTPDVLIPRPETEHLVDAAREELARIAATRPGPTRFADVGTGSGCVAVAVLRHVADATALAIDVSEPALAVARRNAERAGVLARIELAKGDLLAPARERIAAGAPRLDLVVSNPPYIAPEEKPSLSPEVLREPAHALFDASGDLPLTRRLALEARDALAPGGALAVETGAGRADVVRAHLAEAGFADIRTVKDLAGIERVVVGRAP